jgi:hypothetical protein
VAYDEFNSGHSHGEEGKDNDDKYGTYIIDEFLFFIQKIRDENFGT